MYPMAFICLSPLSPLHAATLPQTLEESAEPKPILESQELPWFSLFPRIPILTLRWFGRGCTLNPSMQVTMLLQRGLGSRESLPLVTTQCGGTIFSVGDQWVQGVGMLVDHNEAHLLAEPHTETDLGEVCTPVGWQFSLLLVQSSLPTSKVKVDFIVPQLGIVTKCKLINRKKNIKFPGA